MTETKPKTVFFAGHPFRPGISGHGAARSHESVVFSDGRVEIDGRSDFELCGADLTNLRSCPAGETVWSVMFSSLGECAKQALLIGRTDSGGSVLGTAHEFSRCPPGRWGETQQAKRQFRDAVDEAASRGSDRVWTQQEITEACSEIMGYVKRGLL